MEEDQRVMMLGLTQELPVMAGELDLLVATTPLTGALMVASSSLSWAWRSAAFACSILASARCN